MPAGYEYRLYEGTLPSASLQTQPSLLAAFSWLNLALKGLAIDSRSPLQRQLRNFVNNNPLFHLQITPNQSLADVLNSLLDQIPPNLQLQGIDQELISGDIENPNDPFHLTTVSLRVIMRGDWQIVFGPTTVDVVSGEPSSFDPATKQLRILASLETCKLLSLGLDVQAKFPIGGWNSVAQFGVADGSYVSGLHANLALQPLIGTESYELVVGSGEQFRGFSFTVASLELSNDGAQIDLINAPIGWILDGINYLLTHLYGGLNIYQAIARRVLDRAQAQLLALVPANPPPLLDLPVDEVYGEAFGIPVSQRVTVHYNQAYDLIGPASQPQPRTLIWRGAPPSLVPPVFVGDDFGILANPNWWQDWRSRIIDSIRIDQLIGYDPRNPGPIPTVDVSSLTPTVISEAVGALADPELAARDLAVMSLLRDGVPAPVVGGLGWNEVEVSASSLHVKGLAGTTEYKLTPASIKALRQLGQQAAAARKTSAAAMVKPPPSATRGRAQLPPAGFVFVTADGTPLGLSGVAALASAYNLAVKVNSGVVRFPPPPGPAPGSPAALPDTIPAPLSQLKPVATLGYAVTRLVPQFQFVVLGETGGFNLSLPDLDSATYSAVYPPLAGQSTFSISMLGSPAAPAVDFSTNGLPVLRLGGVPIHLQLSGTGQQPLTVTADLAMDLVPSFLKCSDCVRGKEASFLELVRNIICLADLGLIRISADRVRVLDCILYLYAMTLQPNGAVAQQNLNISGTGTFPQPADANQLPNLLGQLLPALVGQMVPVPVLFDFFHLIPDTVRSSANQQVVAHDGWFTLLIPLLLAVSPP